MLLQGPPYTATDNGGVTHVATDHASVRSSSSSSSWQSEEKRAEPEDLDSWSRGLDHRRTY